MVAPALGELLSRGRPCGTLLLPLQGDCPTLR